GIKRRPGPRRLLPAPVLRHGSGLLRHFDALQSAERVSKSQRLERISPAAHAANPDISLRSPSGPSRSPHRAPLVLRLGRLGTTQASDRKHLVLCLSNCAEVAAATQNFDLKQSVSNRYRGRNGLLTSEFRLIALPLQGSLAPAFQVLRRSRHNAGNLLRVIFVAQVLF